MNRPLALRMNVWLKCFFTLMSSGEMLDISDAKSKSAELLIELMSVF